MTERTKPADTTEENDESGKDGAQQIVDFGSALTKTPHGSVYCMTIIGQIEGHNTAASGAKTTKYEHVLPLLAKLEESDEVNGVLFLLNTVGGDVEAGLAIAELIAGMTKPTVSIVLGGSQPQPDHGSEVPGPDAEKGRYGRRRWQCGLWRGGSVPGHHRPGGRPL